MATEARIVRPFVSFSDSDALFREAVLTFGNRICSSDGQTIFDGDDAEFLSGGTVVQWTQSTDETDSATNAVRAGLISTGIDPHDVSLFVVASSRYLQIADLVTEIPMDEMSGFHHSVEIDKGKARALRAMHHGFTVSAYIALNADRKREPLLPYRRGTWIASTSFKVAIESINMLFRPRPLTNEVRTKLNLGSKVTRYIDWEDHDVLQPADQQVLPLLYVDERVLGQLDAHANTPASKAFQHQLVIDFIEASIFEAARAADLEEHSFREIEDSIIGRIIKMAAPSDYASRQNTLARLANDPKWVVAYAEDRINLRELLLDTLEGASQ